MIGFIGQGFIGKNYADDFENRGYDIVRYSTRNKNEAISECDIVFIAVPTPTTPSGFDFSIVDEVLSLVGEGKIAVIKSTLSSGTTNELQEKHSNIIVLHSPEFLRETSAAHDAAHPDRNIIGIPINDEKHQDAAKKVLSILPEAPYTKICTSKESEIIKYGNNCFLFTKVVFMNIMYDLAQTQGINFDVVSEAMAADPRIGSSHMNPVHKSGPKKVEGRGAGGNCFIKDMAAFIEIYEKNVSSDDSGFTVLKALEKKNIELLRQSNKDIDLLEGVYGE